MGESSGGRASRPLRSRREKASRTAGTDSSPWKNTSLGFTSRASSRAQRSADRDKNKRTDKTRPSRTPPCLGRLSVTVYLADQAE